MNSNRLGSEIFFSSLKDALQEYQTTDCDMCLHIVGSRTDNHYLYITYAVSTHDRIKGFELRVDLNIAVSKVKRVVNDSLFVMLKNGRNHFYGE